MMMGDGREDGEELDSSSVIVDVLVVSGTGFHADSNSELLANDAAA